jgi:hypothetical protein
VIATSFAATTDVLRLQKKDSCIPECGWLQILSQCDCTLIAVWLRLQKLVKKCDCNKPVQKKLNAMTLSKLRLHWSLFDVVATWWKYKWLQTSLTVWLQTVDVLRLQKTQLHKQTCAWLQFYRSVIAK